MPAEGRGSPRVGSRPGAAWPRILPIALFLLATAGVVLLHDDYGVTWDEGNQAEYGERALEYFTTGGRSTRALELEIQARYGPVYEMIPALLYETLDLPKYRTRHLFTGLVALLALPALWLLGRQFRWPLVAPLAVAALLASPRFVGHAFVNSKDIPFAVGVVWLMLASVRLFGGGDLRWRHVAGVTLALGAALWARPGAFPLLLVWLGVAAMVGLWIEAPGTLRGRSERATRTAAVLLAVVTAGWALLVLPWPAAHEDVIGHPLSAMTTSLAFPVEIPVLFGGRSYPSGDLPWRYAFVMLAITVPPGLLALAVLGGVRAVVDTANDRPGRHRVASALLLAWLVVPLALVALLRPRLYDGIRHLLFLLPGLALAAGIGGSWLVGLVAGQRARAVTLGAVLVMIFASLPAMAKLHPYEMTYYNTFVGGTGGAYGRFETDYWVSSYGEAIQWINRKVGPGGRVRVLVAGTPHLRAAAEYAAGPGTEILLERDLTTDTVPAAPTDYYLATTRYGLHRKYPEAPIVHTVGRDGAIFSVVKKLHPEAGDARQGTTSIP